jgi:ketosteroid isomerase-like protein
MADHQTNDICRIGEIRLQCVCAELDLVAEQHSGLIRVASAADEAQRRCPPRRLSFPGVDVSRLGQVLTKHSRSKLRTGRLTEGVVLRDRKQRGDLHLGDGASHGATIDGVFPRCEPTPAACIVVDMNQTTHPTSDPKIEAVQRLYAAYGSGDVDAVLAELDDNVDWAAGAASTSVPWYGNYQGKGDVPRFFKEIGASVDVTEFTLVSLTSNETDVVATIHWAYTVKSTGKRTAMYMQHWWRFANGKIVFFRGSEDTEQSAAAFS